MAAPAPSIRSIVDQRLAQVRRVKRLAKRYFVAVSFKVEETDDVARITIRAMIPKPQQDALLVVAQIAADLVAHGLEPMPLKAEAVPGGTEISFSLIVTNYHVRALRRAQAAAA